MFTPVSGLRNKAFETRIPLNEEFLCETITKSFKETIASNTCGAHGRVWGGGMGYIRIFQGSAAHNRRFTRTGNKKTPDCLAPSFFNIQFFLPDRLFCFFSLVPWLPWRCQRNNEAVTNTLNPQQWKQTLFDSMVHYVNNGTHYSIPFPNF